MTEFIDCIRRRYFDDYNIVNPEKLSNELRTLVESTGMEVRHLSLNDHNDYVFILGQKYVGLANVSLSNRALTRWLMYEFEIEL